MNTMVIDLNADVGEGMNNESQIMPHISSCNIACGGHAGDTETMEAVVELAEQYQVKIGAHPSFPDKEHFGRQPIEMNHAALFTSIKHQIDQLLMVLGKRHLGLHHVKPHGALYNMAAVDHKIATVIIEVMKSYPKAIKLYVPYKSVIEKMALKNRVPITYEVFADRNYNEDGTLVSRQHEQALISDPNLMFEHVYSMITNQKVKSISGKEIKMVADTFCVHSDTPKAIDLIKALKTNLEKHNILIR